LDGLEAIGFGLDLAGMGDLGDNVAMVFSYFGYISLVFFEFDYAVAD
jgi:hypothetical protein